MARHGIAEEIHAIDGSSVSVEIARAKASEEGLSAIHYKVADLNNVRLPWKVYDAAVFHQSLHHVNSIEKLLERVLASLKPNGLLFLDEWTGPSRFEWDTARLANAESLFAKLPQSWRKWAQLRAPIEAADPTEAVRSSAILPSVRRLFSIRLERAYGGQLVSVLLPQLDRKVIPPSELDAILAEWLAIEEADLRRDPGSTYYTAILAQPRRGLGRVVRRMASLAVRFRQAFRYRVLPVLGMRGRVRGAVR